MPILAISRVGLETLQAAAFEKPRQVAPEVEDTGKKSHCCKPAPAVIVRCGSSFHRRCHGPKDEYPDSVRRIEAKETKVSKEEEKPSPDIDGNGVVDLSDLCYLLGVFGQSDKKADFDGNGKVDHQDLQKLLDAFGSRIG